MAEGVKTIVVTTSRNIRLHDGGPDRPGGSRNASGQPPLSRTASLSQMPRSMRPIKAAMPVDWTVAQFDSLVDEAAYMKGDSNSLSLGLF